MDFKNKIMLRFIDHPHRWKLNKVNQNEKNKYKKNREKRIKREEDDDYLSQ
jgi:hypothetical protein